MTKMTAKIEKETINGVDLYTASVTHSDGSGSHSPAFSQAAAAGKLENLISFYQKEGVEVIKK